MLFSYSFLNLRANIGNHSTDETEAFLKVQKVKPKVKLLLILLLLLPFPIKSEVKAGHRKLQRAMKAAYWSVDWRFVEEHARVEFGALYWSNEVSLKK